MFLLGKVLQLLPWAQSLRLAMAIMCVWVTVCVWVAACILGFAYTVEFHSHCYLRVVSSLRFPRELILRGKKENVLTLLRERSEICSSAKQMFGRISVNV